MVAYCEFLSLMFDCHINIEFIGSQKCREYVLKYIMKGTDMAYVAVYDEGQHTGVWDYDESLHTRKCQ